MELARSRLAALRFQNDVRSRDTKLAVAIHRLRALIGRIDASPIEVAGELRRDAAALSPDALRQQALQLRPDLKALQRDQARSVADVRLQMAQGKVDYTISAEFHRQLAPASLSGNEWGLFFSSPLPFFNRNQGEIERARQEARQAEARIAALQTDITSDLRSAWEQYTTTHELVDTIEQQMLTQARDVRDTTAYSYRRGEASFIELLDAQRTFNDTMQGYNEARAEFARSLYTLDALTGGLVHDVHRRIPAATCSYRHRSRRMPVTDRRPASEVAWTSGTLKVPTDSPMLKQIRREKVTEAELATDEVIAPGKIEANPNRVSKVVAPVAGRVVRVLVAVGDAVRQGQPLFTIDSPDADAATSTHLQMTLPVEPAPRCQAQADERLEGSLRPQRDREGGSQRRGAAAATGRFDQALPASRQSAAFRPGLAA